MCLPNVEPIGSVDLAKIKDRNLIKLPDGEHFIGLMASILIFFRKTVGADWSATTCILPRWEQYTWILLENVVGEEVRSALNRNLELMTSLNQKVERLRQKIIPDYPSLDTMKNKPRTQAR